MLIWMNKSIFLTVRVSFLEDYLHQKCCCAEFDEFMDNFGEKDNLGFNKKNVYFINLHELVTLQVFNFLS